MKKILYSAPSVEKVLRYHVPILKKFYKLGYSIHLVVGEGDMSRRIEFVHNFVVNKGMSSSGSHDDLVDLSNLIASERYDIVSSNGNPASWFTRRALRQSEFKPKLNAVMSFGLDYDLGTWPFKRLFRSSIDREFRGDTDLMMVMNSTDLKTARNMALARNVAKIPGTGFDIDAFQPAIQEQRQEARKQLGCGDDVFVFVCCGEFDANHHHRFLINNMQMLHRRIVVFMLGDGVQAKSCRSLIKDRGLEGNVFMPGEVADIMPYLRASDATLSICRYEGFPNFIAKGQAMGIPSVVSAVKGNLDVVTDRRDGLVYTFGRPDSFIEAMQTMTENDGLREAMGQYSMMDCRNFGTDVAVNTIMACYDNALLQNGYSL
ncbi:MAG: glycosyltransferase [Coriobacteriales bacterium]|jgi:glycosyltransferase involved in cell wall biosynthesis